MVPLPTQSATEAGLLLYLRDIQSVAAKNVYGPLADLFELSQVQRQLRMDDGRLWWNNRVQWARKSLVDKSLLDNSVRGIWRLSEIGLGDADDLVRVSANALEAEVDEGRADLKEHMRKERSSTLVALFKASLEVPRCVVCDFSFLDVYGERGRGFIEAHHTVPIGSAEYSGRTKLSDLVSLCSNCHRMVHRRPYLSVEALRASLRKPCHQIA